LIGESVRLYALTVLANKNIAKDHFVLCFELPGNVDEILPGQFMNIFLEDKTHLMPRPFSVFCVEKNQISVLYKVFGKGTDALARVRAGETMRVLLPLGNAFPEVSSEHLCLLSGGIGVVPLYFFAKRVFEKSPSEAKKIRVYLGASNKDGIVCREDFEKMGCSVTISTDDGSLGRRGSCLKALQEDFKKEEVKTIFTCGPHGMLRAVAEFAEEKNILTYLAAEEVMGCGFGACVGCAIPAKQGSAEMPYKLVCTDGPIFEAKEIQW
jgi:dihydroorotate dehydrogenase electron transfer subunit